MYDHLRFPDFVANACCNPCCDRSVTAQRVESVTDNFPGSCCFIPCIPCCLWGGCGNVGGASSDCGCGNVGGASSDCGCGNVGGASSDCGCGNVGGTSWGCGCGNVGGTSWGCHRRRCRR